MTQIRKENMVWRNVVSYRNYINSHANGTGGANVLILDCGHEIGQKFSIEIPKKKRCTRCEGLKLGSVITAGETKEFWDKETNMPKVVKMTEEEQKEHDEGFA